MKKLLIAVIALGTISAFADENNRCMIKSYDEIMSSKTVKEKMEVLLEDNQANLMRMIDISTMARELATEACRQ